MNNQWHILGAGAIGNLWACNLKSMDLPVTLILRHKEKLSLFRQSGSVSLGGKAFQVNAELPNSNQPIQRLLITTKSTDTKAALNSIRHRIAENAKVIVLQNGMGSQEWVSTQLPQAEVAWASTTDGAWLKSAFNVVLAGQGITKIGNSSGSFDWLNKFENGFLKVEPDSDITSTLWRKLAINCAINPLTAIHQCQNGQLTRNPDLLNEMARLCHEIESVANAANHPLFDSPLIEQACHVADITADNFSSMYQDVKYKRLTEIEFINGYLCSLAKDLGIPTPTNSLYLKKVRALQDSY